MNFEQRMLMKYRERIRVVARNLDIEGYKFYLSTWYDPIPNYSERTILKKLHEWRIRIYLDDGGMDEQLVAESHQWLADYIKGK